MKLIPFFQLEASDVVVEERSAWSKTISPVSGDQWRNYDVIGRQTGFVGLVSQQLDGKYSKRIKNPRKSVFVANTWQHLPHLLFCGPLVPNFPTGLFCKQSPVYGVCWPLLPHDSTDRNETMNLVFPLPLGIFAISHTIWCKSVHFF